MYVESSKGKARQIWRFHGGLHLPDNKAQSLSTPLRQAELPDLLILPLQQHIGSPAIPLVKKGERVLKGQKIADSDEPVCAPIHAPTSGEIRGISQQPLPHPSGLSGPCILLKPDGKDEWGELPEPISDFRTVPAETLRQRIHECGIVGMGGATFPTAVKLDPGKPIKTLIINGAECEPYITCDDRLMLNFPDKVVDGIRILQYLLGAEECLIGIEDNKPEAILAMRQALRNQDTAEVVRIPTHYPSGGEKQLIRILTGKEVPSAGLPAQLGIICHNVGTAAAIADAVLTGRPLISRLVTITGEGVAQPCNLEVLIGTPAGELIEQAGGYTDAASGLIYGGPMMGFRLSTDQIPITKGGNCLLLPSVAESPPPESARACIRCSRCADVCPVQLLPQQMYWYARAKELEKAQDYNLFDCIECGCCSHVCPSHIPLVHYFRYAKTESWEQEEERRRSEHAKMRHDFRLARMQRMEAERKARLRKKKEDLAKKPAKGKAAAKDPKKAAIEAAQKRVAAKKAANKNSQKNTDHLQPAQQAQIDAAEQRRQQAEPVEEAPPASGGIENDPELQEIFKQETSSHFATISGFIEQTRAGNDAAQIPAEIPRAFHTICGSARMVGLMPLASLNKSLELYTDSLVEQQQAADKTALALMEDGVDTGKALIAWLFDKSQAEPTIESLLSRIESAGQRRRPTAPEKQPTTDIPPESN
jgi:electron transport complex protein RnfC